MKINNKLKNLKVLRKNKKITQGQIAKILKVSTTTYSNWETGVFEPSIKTLKILANYFNTTIDFLVGRETTNYTKIEKEIIGLAKDVIETKNGNK